LAVNIVRPDGQKPIVIDDSTMFYVFREWTAAITDEVNKRSLIVGTGSPEGVVTAEIGQEYMDDAGTASAIKYIKKTGTSNTGWILI
tara:strand:- start:1213 stop:1473 length:261 start_codon:yes stop_codon:yes gene_type:complete